MDAGERDDRGTAGLVGAVIANFRDHMKTLTRLGVPAHEALESIQAFNASGVLNWQEA